METKVATFDPHTLIETIRDRVKSVFVGVIPDDQWDAMVKKEIDDFFNKNLSRDYNQKYSSFQFAVMGVLQEMAAEKVQQILKEEYPNGVWKDGSYQVSEKLKKIIVENAPEIFANVVGSHVQNMINNSRRY